MENKVHPYVTGSMRKGRNFYSIMSSDGNLVVGLYNKAKAIVVALELAKASGFVVKSYDELEKGIWADSNGNREYHRR